MGVLMIRKKSDRKGLGTEPSVHRIDREQLLDEAQTSSMSADSKRMAPPALAANSSLQNGHSSHGHLPNGEPTDGSSSSNSSDDADNSSAPSVPANAAPSLCSRRSWGLRRPKKASAEAEDVDGAEATVTDQGSKSMTEGSSRRRGSMRNMLRALKPPALLPTPFGPEQPAFGAASVRDDKRKGATAAKLAEDSQGFAVESSPSSATTPRAHSFEAGEPPMGPEAGAPGKAGPVEKKGHSRSRSWVAAVTAPFSRSASGALRPSDEGESAKAEKPAQTPRPSLDGQLLTAPPTPEQLKPLSSTISCLNIFPTGKGSASDSEWETIEPSKGSNLKYPRPLPPLRNIGNTCFMNANLQILLHALPVQAVLCSMPVPGPESDVSLTPKGEHSLRSGGNLSLLPGNTAQQMADHGQVGSMAAADAQTHVNGTGERETASIEAQKLSGNTGSGGALQLQACAQQACAASAAVPAEPALCSCSIGSEKVALPPICEHPEAAKAPSGAVALQAKAPAAPEAASLPAVKTTAEDAAHAWDADSDSSRSQTPVSLVGATTPDIAHPPSAVEALQRGNQPWVSTDSPAAVLQTGVASSGNRGSSMPAAATSCVDPAPNVPTTAASKAAEAADIQGSVAGQAECTEGAGHCCAAKVTDGEEMASTALPPPAAMPELRPGELFRAFRRFAHETLTAPSDEAVNPEALVRTFFRTEIGTPFSNGGQHDTEESLREFMRALEADMAACHRKEDECLAGDACLCDLRNPTLVATPAAAAAPASSETLSPAEPAPAIAEQPYTEAPKSKAKEPKMAEEADKKGKDSAKKAKEDAKKVKEDAKKGEDAEKKAKEAAKKEVSEEALRKEGAKGEKRWVDDTASKLPFEMLFTGQEQSSSTCPKCGSMSTMYDVSTMLTLSLTKKYEGWWAAMLARKTALTLQDCLQGYTQEETLPVDDFVMCDDCKEKTKDKKALKLHRLPEVLLIMLKRTMYPSTEKDDRHITFPLEGLDFTPYLSEASGPEGPAPYTYDLAGVCAHDGKSINSGHYRAVCRRPATCPEEQDAWYMYDDDKPAQLLKPEQVSSQIAYVLCYCRSTKLPTERPKRTDAPV